MSPRRLLAHIGVTLRRNARAVSFAIRRCRKPLDVVLSLLRDSRESTLVLHDGTTITAPELRTLIPLVNDVYFNHEYERNGVYINVGDVVVDIGAHVGVFALHAVAAGAQRVVAFEPSPNNARLFRDNMARNDAHGVELVEAAVGGKAGEASLAIGRWSVGNILHDYELDANSDTLDARSTAIDVDAHANNQLNVRTTTLDDLMAEHNLDRVDFLKMDCEGSEGSILMAASAAALARVDRIALEYHDNWSALNHVAIAQVLSSAGFAVTATQQLSSPFGMIHARRVHTIDRR